MHPIHNQNNAVCDLLAVYHQEYLLFSNAYSLINNIVCYKSTLPLGSRLFIFVLISYRAQYIGSYCISAVSSLMFLVSFSSHQLCTSIEKQNCFILKIKLKGPEDFSLCCTHNCSPFPVAEQSSFNTEVKSVFLKKKKSLMTECVFL